MFKLLAACGALGGASFLYGVWMARRYPSLKVGDLAIQSLLFLKRGLCRRVYFGLKVVILLLTVHILLKINRILAPLTDRALALQSFAAEGSF